MKTIQYKNYNLDIFYDINSHEFEIRLDCYNKDEINHKFVILAKDEDLDLSIIKAKSRGLYTCTLTGKSGPSTSRAPL